MSKNDSREIFSILDMWASYFHSSHGETSVPSFILVAIRIKFCALQVSPEVSKIIECFDKLIGENNDTIDLNNSCDLNKMMFNFFVANVPMLPEEGRVILSHCRKFFS